MELQEPGPNLSLNGFNPQKVIHTSCPYCEKKYLVSTESLTYGRAQFQCHSCQKNFAINWYGERALEPDKINFFEGIKLEGHTETKDCPHCGRICDKKSAACPACGVKFKNKVVVKVKNELNMDLADPELAEVWSSLKKNFDDEDLHHAFLQLAIEKKSLPLAAQSYSALLKINPSDPIAKKMLNLLTQISQGQPEQIQNRDKTVKQVKFNLYKFTVGTCLISILFGVGFEAMRPLIALGSSVLLFAIIVHHWISTTEY